MKNETIKTEWSLRSCFEQMRDSNGDVMLTEKQQEEIIRLVEGRSRKWIKLKKTMPSLPNDLDDDSNCDCNFKLGWLACWDAYMANEVTSTSIQEQDDQPLIMTDVRKHSGPNRCPVCNGNGLVPNFFYAQASNYQSTSSFRASPEPCRSCNGSGIVFR